MEVFLDYYLKEIVILEISRKSVLDIWKWSSKEENGGRFEQGMNRMITHVKCVVNSSQENDEGTLFHSIK